METTYEQLKMRKADLRNQLEAERNANDGEVNASTFGEYIKINCRLQNAERKLLVKR